MNLTPRYPKLLYAFSQLPLPVAVVDLESTGGHFYEDRVTEVAVLHFYRGEIRTFNTLIHPQQTISPFIERLTGIRNDMVAAAPRFADIASELLPLLRGSLLVAHNSRFDYTFLRHEFARAGHPFAAPTLCTVQLSRQLYPQHHKHNLETIIERHGIRAPQRHRALADVLALCDFLELSLQETDAAHWQQTVHKLLRPGLLPDWLPAHLSQQIHALPDSHGISIWHHPGHQQPQLLVHEQAFQEIHALLRQAGAADRWQATRHIEFLPSLGPLHNMAQMAAYLHRHGLKPANHHSVAPYRSINWQLHQGYLKAKISPLADGFYPQAPTGLFLHPKGAKRALNDWAQQNGLCPALLGILPDGHADACPRRILKQCGGDCDQRHQETAVRRLAADLPVCDWGHTRSVLLTERHPFSSQQHTFRCRGGAIEWTDGAWFFDSRIPKWVKERLKKRDGVVIEH